MNERYDGYNRGDYYYPRSTREAFGHRLSKEDIEWEKQGASWDMVVGIVCMVIGVVYIVSYLYF